jgi:hypothetical protein
MYYVFVRDWWKDNPEWPNGLEPCPGPEEVIEKYIQTEEEARRIAKEYNKTHAPGRLSRKAEFAEMEF